MTFKEFVPFAPPLVEEKDIAAVQEALMSGWISTGPRTKKFEEEFKSYIGASDALALNSCTAGLHLALKVLGVGPGDEVITTPMTFCATANVVEHLGGTTVLADIDPDTLLIDPNEIEEKVSPKTKVILPVHYAGQSAPMTRINEVAKENGIHVLEDAAHCMPTKEEGKWVGSGDNLTSFSFYATKNVTTGEGGMLTGPEELIAKARTLSLHGMSRDAWKRFQKGGSWKYDVPEPGYKYNMTDLQAALGSVQLEKLNRMYEIRKRQVDIYNQVFEGGELLKPLKSREESQHSHHLYVILLQIEKLRTGRDEIIQKLTDLNIGTSVHYIPIHMHSYYKNKYGWKNDSFPKATHAFERILSLPLSPAHSLETIEMVAKTVRNLLESEAC